MANSVDESKCWLYCDQKAGYFAEFQLLALDNAGFIAETDSPLFPSLDNAGFITETGRTVYGWWGPCCAECLRQVQETPELIWLEAIPLSDVAITSKRGQHEYHEYHPDWSKATIQVGSRVPSERLRRLLAACNQAPPRVTPHEALERLAVLRILRQLE